MSAPNSRPVHPCVSSITKRACRGAEFSTWVYLTHTRADNNEQQQKLPNLVTASGSTLNVYTPHANTGQLKLEETFPNIAGTIVFLAALPAKSDYESDALLIGFGAPARLSVVTLMDRHLKGEELDDGDDEQQPAQTPQQASTATATAGRRHLLQAICLLDFTSVWNEHCCGATMQEDAFYAVLNDRGTATVAVVLGGGTAVAVTELVAHALNTTHEQAKKRHGWFAKEPYVLPLMSLSSHLPHLSSSAASEYEQQQQQQQQQQQNNPQQQQQQQGPESNGMVTGWGDIYHAIFLSGYSTTAAETLVLLHSAPGGNTWTGRLARENTLGPAPLHLTALSISVSHSQTALLWSLPMTSDAQTLHALPAPPAKSSSRGQGSGGVGLGACIVLGTNTIVSVHGTGRIHQVLAVNGWARTTCPAGILASLLRPNPTGLKLALQLDGSACCFLNENTALIVLRRGHVYMLQRLPNDTASDSSGGNSNPSLAAGQWSLLPTGETLTAMGEVAHLSAPLLTSPDDNNSNNIASLLQSNIQSTNKRRSIIKREEAEKKKNPMLSTGLVFAGSRLGDSFLLGYAVDIVKLSSSPLAEATNEAEDKAAGVKVKQEEIQSSSNAAAQANNTHSNDHDRILAMEEEALYAPVTTPQSQTTAALPNVSDEDDDDDTAAVRSSITKRPRPSATKLSVLRFLTPLDRIVHLGPVGPSCEGPISAPPEFLLSLSQEQQALPSNSNNNNNSDKETVFGASAFIFPCGFGSSGGLALATMPGRDDRMIVAEEDCLNVSCTHSLPHCRLVLLGLSSMAMTTTKTGGGGGGGGGIKVLRQKPPSASASSSDGGSVAQWEELEEWTDPRDETMTAIAASSVLLNACEMGRDGTFALLLQNNEQGDNGKPSWRIAILNWNKEMVRCDFLDDFFVTSPMGAATATTDYLVASTPFLTYRIGDEEHYGTACRWSSGRANLVLFSRTGLKCSVDIPYENDKMDVSPEDEEEELDEDEDTKKMKQFYRSKDITSLDLFRASSWLGSHSTDNDSSAKKEERDNNTSAPHSAGSTGRDNKVSFIHPDFDEDDMDLYGLSSATATDTKSREESNHEKSPAPDLTYLALFRQSGLLELYQVGDANGELTRCWVCNGGERGLDTLVPCQTAAPLPLPRSHQVKIDETRFFTCGPASSLTSQPRDEQQDTEDFRSLCMALSTSNGDLFLYTIKHQTSGASRQMVLLEREPLCSVTRRAQEQSRHRTKLMKKGIVPKKTSSDHDKYVQSRFFRFHAVSGQDGLFAALAQPKWIVSERGKPVTLCHRTRHSAPAGAKPAPVTGFCSPLPMGGFLTLHERVGRFGSQRLTMFRGISPVFEEPRPSLTPGGGFCVERIAIGVTVRQIRFLDDESTSSGDHPLYAVLVSRELEVDQSDLNDDGMTAEEREKAEREKEEARIQRQVEADLGGFDVEQEWVEEIVRDDVFHIQDFGGAPPLMKEFYSLWIVDAADEWRVVDSYDLEEFEHGLTLQVMKLSEFKSEPGTNASIDIADVSNTTFVALGTGTVNHNGEDVGSKGRVLLFEVKKLDTKRKLTSRVASLSLTYEKDIFHGPVTSLSCLSAEGRNRLIVGAGADVNVEQWGQGKLTQVGFFRATMQILNIMLFKNFFLLSDAYDSLYFLVWRESDKSLTLLAKDYDPMVLYAVGIMSRGATMTFICHDDRQNLQFMQYAPGEAAARGGNKLVCRSDFHLGTQTTAFRQHYCRSSLLVHSATPASTVAALKQQDGYHGRSDDDQRLGVHFGTTDGQIFSIVPLSEPVYWRLAALQSVLANALESDCALSPRAWRLYRRSNRRGGCRSNDRKKGVIDGDLIVDFANLPLTDQEDLASAIGSTVDLILDNLLEVENSGLML